MIATSEPCDGCFPTLDAVAPSLAHLLTCGGPSPPISPDNQLKAPEGKPTSTSTGHTFQEAATDQPFPSPESEEGNKQFLLSPYWISISKKKAKPTSPWPVMDPELMTCLDLSRGAVCLGEYLVEMMRLGAASTIAAVFAGLSWQAPTRRSDAYGPLQFRSDGTFQLSIFEDLHFGESKMTSRDAFRDE